VHIFSPCLALMRSQRIEREVIEAEEARAACAPGSSPSKLLTRGSQPPGARSLAEDARRGSRGSLAGMVKTSMCVFHETDREMSSRTSTCGFQLMDLEVICRGLSSGPEARRKERWELCERVDPVMIRWTGLALVPLLLFGLRGLDGIWRHDDRKFMLGGVADDGKIRGMSRLAFAPGCPGGQASSRGFFLYSRKAVASSPVVNWPFYYWRGGDS